MGQKIHFENYLSDRLQTKSNGIGTPKNHHVKKMSRLYLYFKWVKKFVERFFTCPTSRISKTTCPIVSKKNALDSASPKTYM